MNEPVPSYVGKTFDIDDNLCVIRNPNNIAQSSRYKPGDAVPPGNRVGDKKVIPLMTQVMVSGVRTHGNRDVYVFAEPANADPMIPSGWTRSTNLHGGFINELVDFAPAEWDLEPLGNNFTVTNKKALLRTGSLPFRSLGTTVPVGTYVIVTAKSKDTDPRGKFVRVSRGKIENGGITAVEPLG